MFMGVFYFIRISKDNIYYYYEKLSIPLKACSSYISFNNKMKWKRKGEKSCPSDWLFFGTTQRIGNIFLPKDCLLCKLKKLHLLCKLKKLHLLCKLKKLHLLCKLKKLHLLCKLKKLHKRLSSNSCPKTFRTEWGLGRIHPGTSKTKGRGQRGGMV